MNPRRRFMKFAAAAALPVSAGLVTGIAHADDGDVKEFLGAWKTKHTLPPGGPQPDFTEFLTFADGGVLTETNAFLHTSSNLNPPFFPIPAANASDGMGNWERIGRRQIAVAFRKLIFSRGQYAAELKVEGILFSDGVRLDATWRRIALELLDGTTIFLGTATSTGTRIRY